MASIALSQNLLITLHPMPHQSNHVFHPILGKTRHNIILIHEAEHVSYALVLHLAGENGRRCDCVANGVVIQVSCAPANRKQRSDSGSERMANSNEAVVGMVSEGLDNRPIEQLVSVHRISDERDSLVRRAELPRDCRTLHVGDVIFHVPTAANAQNEALRLLVTNKKVRWRRDADSVVRHDLALLLLHFTTPVHVEQITLRQMAMSQKGTCVALFILRVVEKVLHVLHALDLVHEAVHHRCAVDSCGKLAVDGGVTKNREMGRGTSARVRRKDLNRLLHIEEVT